MSNVINLFNRINHKPEKDLPLTTIGKSIKEVFKELAKTDISGLDTSPAVEAVIKLYNSPYINEIISYNRWAMSSITFEFDSDNVLSISNRYRELLHPEFPIQSHTEYLKVTKQIVPELQENYELPNNILNDFMEYTGSFPQINCNEICFVLAVVSKMIENPKVRYYGITRDSDNWTLKLAYSANGIHEDITVSFSFLPFILDHSAYMKWEEENKDEKD
jgi:hypothetical protein